MKRLLSVIVWSALAASACKIPAPAQPGPVPSQPGFTDRGLVLHVQPANVPVSGCSVQYSLQPQTDKYTGTTDASGVVGWSVRLPAPDPGGWQNARVHLECPGFQPLDDAFLTMPTSAAGNQDVWIGGAYSGGNNPILRPGPKPLAPPKPPIKTWADTSTGVCNFGSALDAQGRHIFTPWFAQLWEQQRWPEAEDWLARLAAEGDNCVVLSIHAGAYPGYFLEQDIDYRNNMSRFGEFLTWLQGHAAGDGAAWRFVTHLADGPGDDIAIGARVAQALPQFNAVTIYSPSFEIMRDWPAKLVADWGTALHVAFSAGQRFMLWGQPNALVPASYHGDGTAASCAAQQFAFVDYADPSRPGIGACVELDDPWQGNEVASVGSHGTEWFTDIAFQTEHGRAVIDPCARTIDDGRGRGLKFPDGCSMGRFDDGVARMGAQICSDDYGHGSRCGWPRKVIWLMETDTYDAFHGNSTPAIAERIANQGQVICAFYGVSCNYGSGGPTSLRPSRAATFASHDSQPHYSFTFAQR